MNNYLALLILLSTFWLAFGLFVGVFFIYDEYRDERARIQLSAYFVFVFTGFPVLVFMMLREVYDFVRGFIADE